MGVLLADCSVHNMSLTPQHVHQRQASRPLSTRAAQPRVLPAIARSHTQQPQVWHPGDQRRRYQWDRRLATRQRKRRSHGRCCGAAGVAATCSSSCRGQMRSAGFCIAAPGIQALGPVPCWREAAAPVLLHVCQRRSMHRRLAASHQRIAHGCGQGVHKPVQAREEGRHRRGRPCKERNTKIHAEESSTTWEQQVVGQCSWLRVRCVARMAAPSSCRVVQLGSLNLAPTIETCRYCAERLPSGP